MTQHLIKNKLILDASCGGRMMWFNKNNPNAIYIDNRRLKKGEIGPTHPNFEVNPDIVMDFRNMDFLDKQFKLVVWDPPHITSLSKTSWMAKKYGILDKNTWKEYLKSGFEECWRVLDDYGVLIFKWSEGETSAYRNIHIKDVLAQFSQQPLFGHPTAKNGKTIWMTFMKIPPK